MANNPFKIDYGLVVANTLLFANNSQVGINTNSPDAALTVVGSANVRGSFLATSNITTQGGFFANSASYVLNNFSIGSSVNNLARLYVSGGNILIDNGRSFTFLSNTNAGVPLVAYDNGNNLLVGDYQNVSNTGALYFYSGSTTPRLTLTRNGDASLTGNFSFNGQQALNATNYNLYAPTLGGVGAFGTWGINITGGASFATNSTNATNANNSTYWNGQAFSSYLNQAVLTSSAVSFNTVSANRFDAVGNQTGDISNATGGLGGVLVQGPGGGNAAYMGFLRPGSFGAYFGIDGDNQFKVGGWSIGGSYPILHSGNYNSYSPQLNGTGSYGTWAINVTGSSSFATNSTNSNYSTYAARILSQGAGYAQLLYSGQGGQPTWLWGTNNGTDFYVWNPSNFSVNYATSAGYASNSNNATYWQGQNFSSFLNQSVRTDQDVTFNRIYGSSIIQSNVGYKTKAGSDGNIGGNVFNVDWTGTGIRFWIDNVLEAYLEAGTNILADKIIAYRNPYTGYITSSGGSTCFPINSKILMADGSYELIQNIEIGDLLMTYDGTAVECIEMDKPILGDRKMLTFKNDLTVLWSEEHCYWTKQEDKEWWWSYNPETWRKEVEIGAIKGLKDNNSLYTGNKTIFAHVEGWKEQEVIEISGFDYNTQLYLPVTAGKPIIVNNYLVGAGINEFNFDYNKIKWEGLKK